MTEYVLETGNIKMNYNEAVKQHTIFKLKKLKQYADTAQICKENQKAIHKIYFFCIHITANSGRPNTTACYLDGALHTMRVFNLVPEDELNNIEAIEMPDWDEKVL